MTAALDHMIVFARDRKASAAYLAEMLGAPGPTQAGHFTQVQVDHGLTVDFMETSGNIAPQHYAFLVSDAQFDVSLEKICAHQPYWADPYRRRPNEVHSAGEGRVVYFEDPNGHFLEIRTKPSRA